MYYGLIVSETVLIFLHWILLPWLVVAGISNWYNASYYKHKYNSIIGIMCCILLVLHLTGVFNVVQFANEYWILLASVFTGYIILAYPYTKHVSWKRYLGFTYQAYKQRIEDIKHRANNESVANRQIESYGYNKPITVSDGDHRRAFIDMMAYWPFHLVKDSLRTIFEGVRGIFNRIFNRFVTSLQQQANIEFEKNLKE